MRTLRIASKKDIWLLCSIVLVFSSVALFVGVSCSTRPRAVLPASKPACVIREIVFSEQWKTNSELFVFADGIYFWRIVPLQATASLSPELSKGLFKSFLVTSLQCSATSEKGWQREDGMPVYELYVDDTKTRHPKAVVDALDMAMDDMKRAVDGGAWNRARSGVIH